MSKSEKLVRMANQIAAFFKPYPHDEAVVSVHNHIRAYWTPPMRAELAALCENEPTKLDPLVNEAMRAEPTAVARSLAAKEAAAPAKVGELGSSGAG